MVNIIHGEDSSKSRQYLDGLNLSFQRYDAVDGNIDELRQILDGNSLFALSPNVLIENLFSKKAKNVEEIITLVNKTSANVYVYDSKEVTPKNLKLFPKAKMEIFSLPKSLFAFLESIYPGNKSSIKLFENALEGSEIEILIFMMVRQLRIMLASTLSANIDETSRLQDWQRSRVLKQASFFGLEKLKKSYREIFEIDTESKSGGLKLPLKETIDMWLINL